MSKSKSYLQSILFILLCVVVLFSSVQIVHAKGGFVTQRKENRIFYAYDTDVYATEDGTYPYNYPNITIKRVGFDILYGSSKALVHYTGEVPYVNTRDENDEMNSGFEGLPYNPGKTDIDISDSGYWGSTSIANGSNINVEDLEAVNESSINSLRLHALSISAYRSLIDFGNIGYSIFKGLARGASSISHLIIMIKNINMSQIIEQLNLDELGKLMNRIFIADTNAAGDKVLSPLAIFCIIAFMFSLVAFVVQYIKGGKKEKNLFGDIILFGIIGLIIVGIALNNGAASLGTSISDFTTKIVQTMDEATGDELFSTKTEGDSRNSSMDTMTTEISKLNQAMIDLQICIQFGVSSIDELAFNNEQDDSKGFGDTSYTIAKDVLLDYDYNGNTYTATSDLSSCQYNLGYYFWWANSSAETMTDSCKTIPSTTTLQEAKLTKVVTYLQRVYNKAKEDNKTNRMERIKLMIEHLSRPSAAKGIVNMLLMTVIFILLAICLWKYAFKVVLAKMALVAGILGLPVAGLLIVTTKDNLVKTGKGILGIFAMSFIRITVFSIFFDIVIYLLTAILKPDILVQLICAVMLFFMMKINPAIELTIEKALQGIERTISPEARQLKHSIKGWARRKSSDVQGKIDANIAKYGKTIGYDEHGNEIKRGSRAAVAMSAMNAAFSNSLNEDFTSRKSFGKIKAEATKKGQDVTNAAYNTLVDSNIEQKNKKLKDSQDNITRINREIQDRQEDKFNEVKIKDESGENRMLYHRELLTEEENSQYDQINAADHAYEMLINDKDYKALKRKEALKEQMTKDEIAELENYDNIAIGMREKLHTKQIELNDTIRKRIASEVRSDYQDVLTKAYEEQYIAQGESIYSKTSGTVTVDPRTGLKSFNYGSGSHRLTVEDFKNQLYIERQLEAIKRNEDASKVSRVGLDEVANEMYEKYVTSYQIHGHGVTNKQREQAINELMKKHSEDNLSKHKAQKLADKQAQKEAKSRFNIKKAGETNQTQYQEHQNIEQNVQQQFDQQFDQNEVEYVDEPVFETHEDYYAIVNGVQTDLRTGKPVVDNKPQQQTQQNKKPQRQQQTKPQPKQSTTQQQIVQKPVQQPQQHTQQTEQQYIEPVEQQYVEPVEQQHVEQQVIYQQQEQQKPIQYNKQSQQQAYKNKPKQAKQQKQAQQPVKTVEQSATYNNQVVENQRNDQILLNGKPIGTMNQPNVQQSTVDLFNQDMSEYVRNDLASEYNRYDLDQTINDEDFDF